jgi:hypothetical protein
VRPESSRVPLTLGELVALLDHAHAADGFATQIAYGLIERFWERDLLAGDPPEHAANFVTVSSPFYPALAAYYQDRAEDMDRDFQEGTRSCGKRSPLLLMVGNEPLKRSGRPCSSF